MELPDLILKDLNTDQHLLYMRCQAAITGVLPRDIALRKGGAIVHSRWLTTAIALIELWQSDHKLTGDLLSKLRKIVTFIVTVYCPMWFQIKVNHCLLD